VLTGGIVVIDLALLFSVAAVFGVVSGIQLKIKELIDFVMGLSDEALRSIDSQIKAASRAGGPISRMNIFWCLMLAFVVSALFVLVVATLD
jgi:hypothetical protein